MADNIYLALLLPLWIFLIIMLGRFFSVYVNAKITGGLTLLASAFGGLICTFGLIKFPVDMIYESSYPFVHVNDFIISCGIHADRLSFVFGAVLFAVSFLVQIFALYYMRDEDKSYRFFALLNLFNFSMAGLFFSPNLYQTYVFWEIAGVASYLLIGFEYDKFMKSLASKKVFIMNRIGDTAFIGGIILCSYFMYEYASDKTLTTLSYVDMNTISALVNVYASRSLFVIICCLFILAAVVKSAQFPFYTWLQDAMEAKMPVSALLHSATLLACGLFLTLRMSSFYTFEPVLLKILVITGLFTALVCSLCACAQRSPKKVLAYSTSAQFGLMYFGVGLLNIKAAVVFFAAHAFIKSMLFITLPKEEQKWDYLSFILFLIGGLSLSGILFAGMIAKEMLSADLGTYMKPLFSVVSFLTAFYIIRIAVILADEHELEKRNPALWEFIPVLGLTFFNIVLYIYFRRFDYKIAEPFWAALFGWICVYLLYINKGFRQIPVLYPIALNGFYLDKFYVGICARFYEMFSKCANFVDTKILGEYRPLIWTLKAGVKTFEFIETKIMDGGVNLIKESVKRFSAFDLMSQSGNVQRYNAYAFVIIAFVVTCLVLVYVINIIYYLGGI